MYQSQDVLLEAVVTAPNDDRDLVVCADGIVRYQYSKMGFVCRKFVIVDVGPDGHEEFWEQEVGEVCWHSYYPCVAERFAFHGFVASNRMPGDWPLLNIAPAEKQRNLAPDSSWK